LQTSLLLIHIFETSSILILQYEIMSARIPSIIADRVSDRAKKTLDLVCHLALKKNFNPKGEQCLHKL
jgi:hypothetical protein